MAEIHTKISSGSVHYVRVHKKHASTWLNEHASTLVDTLAHKLGPDVIAILEDDCSYSDEPAFGGAHESTQRVPLMIRVPGSTGGTATTQASWVRLVDVLPTVYGGRDRFVLEGIDGTNVGWRLISAEQASTISTPSFP
jgi:hypothetical protein